MEDLKNALQDLLQKYDYVEPEDDRLYAYRDYLYDATEDQLPPEVMGEWYGLSSFAQVELMEKALKKFLTPEH